MLAADSVGLAAAYADPGNIVAAGLQNSGDDLVDSRADVVSDADACSAVCSLPTKSWIRGQAGLRVAAPRVRIERGGA